MPTVWTNAATAYVLATPKAPTNIAGLFQVQLFGFLLLSSVAYVAGMILNDAFDADYDARLRPQRPIPRGDVTARKAFGVGLGLLAFAVAGLTWLGSLHGHFWPTLACAVALAVTIVVYDAHHKNNPLGPLLMGLCRGLLYVTIGLALGGLGPLLLLAAALQVAYVLGLTYAAKQEDLATPGSWWPLGLLLLVVGYVAGFLTLGGGAVAHTAFVLLTLGVYLGWLVYATRPLLRTPRNIGQGVGRLIAGVAALDAVMLSTAGNVGVTALALAALATTLVLHRLVPGT